MFDPTLYQDTGREKLLRDFLKGRRDEDDVRSKTTSQEGITADANVDRDQHPSYHMVFSTSCDAQQNWESFVFFYHAHKVKQPGTVTRICSGCNDEEKKGLIEFHQKYIENLSENFHVHFTPDFGSLTKTLGLGNKKYYKYTNKPYGLKHWMENVLHMKNETHAAQMEDGIIMLLDPDMILLRPLVHDFTKEKVIFAHDEEPRTKVVKHGYPMAQQDGYLSNEWMTLNISYITAGTGNIKHVKWTDGPIFYNSGPPYLATVRDMYNITVKWCDYVLRGTSF
jgi:hypothetical protein